MAIIKEFDTEKTILKYFDCKAFAVKLMDGDLAVAVNGRKIIKAGTPYPANDATATGLVLHDYDVTDGAVEGAVMYSGAVSAAKITANGVTIAEAVKTANPKIKFFA